MPNISDKPLLEALLDSWDRNNAILVNLLRLVPEDGLQAKAAEGSPTVAAMFMHMHFVRLVFISEDIPEFPVTLPEGEWRSEGDPKKIAKLLKESAQVVRDAVKSQVEAGKEMKVHYDHPILFLQHMIWHEGYHQGQIKLTLKLTGHAISDDDAGPVTWDVWMDKS